MPISEVKNDDCMNGMENYPDKFWELAIVDPPYGIKDWNKRGSNNLLFAGNNAVKLKEWDKKPNDKYWNELFRVSRNQIVWGANHFIEHLYSTKATIIWDKNNVGMHFNNYELAWVSGIREANRIFRMSSSQITETVLHPTQKPIRLYKWLLQNYAKPGDKILDTHLGSGSSRIAAYKLGFDFWGWEKDYDYYIAQEERFKKAIAQPLFDEIKKHEQSKMF